MFIYQGVKGVKIGGLWMFYVDDKIFYSGLLKMAITIIADEHKGYHRGSK